MQNMNQKNYLLSSDYDENDNQYFYVYDWRTLEIVCKSFIEQQVTDFYNSLIV